MNEVQNDVITLKIVSKWSAEKKLFQNGVQKAVLR
jgi:hypothetical protein